MAQQRIDESSHSPTRCDAKMRRNAFPLSAEIPLNRNSQPMFSQSWTLLSQLDGNVITPLSTQASL
jgi:hypothetical protein